MSSETQVEFKNKKPSRIISPIALFIICIAFIIGVALGFVVGFSWGSTVVIDPVPLAEETLRVILTDTLDPALEQTHTATAELGQTAEAQLFATETAASE